MKQSEISKEAMADALRILLQDTPYHQISITNIAQKAGVSRLTFYRNFESKEDILPFYFDCAFKKYATTLQADKLDAEQVLTCFFHFWQSSRPLLAVCFQNDLHRILRDPMEKYFDLAVTKIQYQHSYTQTQKTFILGGLFDLIISFVRNPPDQTPEEMAKDLLEMLNFKRATQCRIDVLS